MVAQSNIETKSAGVPRFVNHSVSDEASRPSTSIARCGKLLALAGLALSGGATVPADTGAGMMRHRHRMISHPPLPLHLRPGHATLDSVLRPAAASAQMTAPASDHGMGGAHRSLAGDGITHSPPGITHSPPGIPPTPANTSTPAVISSPLIGCPSTGFMAPVTVGGQTFQVQIDTGSWSLGVAGAGCTTCPVTPLYAPGTTAQDQHKPVVQDYVSSNWTGDLISDQVGFAGGPTVSLSFGAMNSSYDFFIPFVCNRSVMAPPAQILNQGIMGLNPLTDLPAGGLQSYITQAFSAMNTKVYAFAPCQDNGMFYLGGHPTDIEAGPLFYTPLATPNETTYVASPITGASLGNVDLNFTLQNLGYSLLDTGTTEWILPPAQYDTLVDAVSNATGGIFDRTFFGSTWCKTLPNKSIADVNALAPALTIRFATPAMSDGNTHVVSYPASGSYLDAQPDGKGGTSVCGMVASNPDFTIFGAALMRHLVLEYDFAKQQVGIGVTQNICP